MALTASYRREFKQLVVKLSRQLSIKECEELFYTYKEDARLTEDQRPSAVSSGAFQLHLFESLEKAREFSCYEPCKLKDILSTIERNDLIEAVESFLVTNKETIEQLSHTYEQLYIHTEFTERGNVYEQATEDIELPVDKDGQINNKSLNQAAPSEEIENGDYVKLQRPTSTESLPNLKPPKSGSLTQRQLPPTPQKDRVEHKPRVKLRRRHGFRRKSKSNYRKSISGKYSYIDVNLNPRTLQIDAFTQSVSKVSSPTPSSCPSVSTVSLYEEQLGTFLSSDDRPQSSTSPDIEESSESDSCEEHIYERLQDNLDYALRIVTSRHKHVVEEEIEVTVASIRKMICEHDCEAISSDKFAARHPSISNTFFQLKISAESYPHQQQSVDSKRGKSSETVSAELLLVSMTKFPNSLHLQAHIQVLIPEQPTQPMQRNHLKHYNEVGIANSKKIICDQTVLIDLPSSLVGDCDKGTSDSDSDVVPIAIASFPNLISHVNFMKSDLICASYLCINLFVREY